MKIGAIDSLGNLKEYDVILTYYSDEYDKNYVVYTDNIYNSNNELQIYINSYNPNEIECVSEEIKDKDEYNTIKVEINKILLSMKNESERLDSLI